MRCNKLALITLSLTLLYGIFNILKLSLPPSSVAPDVAVVTALLQNDDDGTKNISSSSSSNHDGNKHTRSNNNITTPFSQLMKSRNYAEIVQRYQLAKTEYQAQFSSLGSWCTHNYSQSVPTGILHVKMPKAASSTTSGIALRISHRFSSRRRRQDGQMTAASDGLWWDDIVPTAVDDPCDAHVEHVQKKGKLVYQNRDKSKSFLFTSIRDPTKRAISRVFFTYVSQGKHLEPTDENVIKGLQRSDYALGVVAPHCAGYQLQYASLTSCLNLDGDDNNNKDAWSNRKKTNVRNPIPTVHQFIHAVMTDYDFIILVERFDESLVAMQMLLNLDAGDVLYLSSKSAGSYFYNQKCSFIEKSFVSPAVNEYLTSEEWYAKNYGDFLLWEAASQRLDLTIGRLGRERFEDNLKKFRLLKGLVDERCAERVAFPCSETGVPQPKLAEGNCYRRDWGCGYPCIDELVRNETSGDGGLLG